jgi:arylsulfatase A-like enzyme
MKLFFTVILLSLPLMVSAEDKHNIIFIEVDDLTAKFLGFNGYPGAKTPNIDALAASGVYFKNAVCQGTMCGPSRNSLITALYPHNLGMYVNGQLKSLPKDVWTFPAALQRSGYYTTWIGKCHIKPYIDGRASEDKKTEAMAAQMGFDYVEQTVGRVVLKKKANVEVDATDIYMKHLLSKNLLQNFLEEYPKVSTLPEEDYLDGYFTQRALNWLENYKEKKPFFLWINYSVPHGPYDVAAKYHTFDPKKMLAPIADDLQGIPQAMLDHNTPVKSMEKTLKDRADYLAAISFMDGQVGKLMSSLKEKGLLEKSIVVFFSDHGVMAGDHGRDHKGTLWKEVLNPSLIIVSPDLKEKGKVVSQPVELLDLASTVIDWAGGTEKAPNGISLKPLLNGEGLYSREAAFGEIEGYTAAVTEKYKYISGATPLLFNLQNDPDELVNVLTKEPEVAESMKKIVESHFALSGQALHPQLAGKDKKSKE